MVKIILHFKIKTSIFYWKWWHCVLDSINNAMEVVFVSTPGKKGREEMPVGTPIILHFIHMVVECPGCFTKIAINDTTDMSAVTIISPTCSSSEYTR